MDGDVAGTASHQVSGDGYLPHLLVGAHGQVVATSGQAPTSDAQ